MEEVMNNLYVYGCSFAWSPDDDNAWPRKLAKHYNLELVNKGFPGYGILQTFEAWKLLEKDMKPGDMNIVCLSSPDRTYFFPEAPFFSQLAHADAPNILDQLTDNVATKIKKSKSSYVNYYVDLHQPQHFLWLVECWLRWLDVKSKDLGVKTIVIPAFPELLPALEGNFENLLIFKKSLMDISEEEYGDPKYGRVFNGPYDLRANHLCISNHNVLVAKVIESLELGYVKESTVDWHSGLIKSKNILDENWRKKEFSYAKFDEKFFYEKNIYDTIVDHLIKDKF